MKLTNLMLVHLALFLIVSLALGIILYPIDSINSVLKILIFIGVAFGVNVVSAVILNVARVKFISADSVWLQAPPKLLGETVTKIVIFVGVSALALVILIALS